MVWSIGSLSLFPHGGPHEGGAEITRVEQDELDPFTDRAEGQGIVDSGRLATPGILRFAKKIQEDLLGFGFLRVLPAGIVFAIVVIIPDR